MSKYKHGHGAQGEKRSREYRTWRCMRGRCMTKTGPGAEQYVAKGITVCEEWNDFLSFYRDMGPQPPGKTIDRIDNTKGYFKENCRWADKFQQARNKSTNRLIEINGETKCLKEWAEIYGMPYKLVHSRWHHLGWPLGIALTVASCDENKRFPRH